MKKKNVLLSAEAIRLLRKVKTKIKNKPHAYNQAMPCGTVQCICGWMKFFAGLVKIAELHEGGGAILTRDQYDRLFNASMWPKKFYRNKGASWQKIKASTAIRRIDHFIATDGKE